MSDDDRNVSAREWRAVREGDAHAAPKTSQNNTPESFIVGVGASGALLAGAAIVFVTLVGLVSFNVWPTAQDSTTDGNVELSAATPRNGNGTPSNSTVVPLSAAAGQLAATNVGPPTGAGGGGNGGGGNAGGKGKPKPAPAPTPPGTTPAPPNSGGSDGTGGGSTGSGPVTGVKDPSHEVSPTHPSGPHESTPEGEKGKDPEDGNDGVGIGIAGKPPVARPPSDLPTPPSSDQDEPSEPSSSDDDDDDSSSGGGHHHGCSHSHDHGYHHDD